MKRRSALTLAVCGVLTAVILWATGFLLARLKPEWIVCLTGPLQSALGLRRSVPVQIGAGTRWQGGNVLLYDYSYDPGGYENHIEWLSPTGAREHLGYVGDGTASLTVLADGRLQARFYSEKRPPLRLIVLTWRDPHSRPFRQE